MSNLQQHVIPLNFEPEWDCSAALPLIMQTEKRVTLVYYLPAIQRENHKQPIAIVDIKDCAGIQWQMEYGEKNRKYHPLWKSGLNQCEYAGIVENSQWINHFQKVKHDTNLSGKHYVFLFPDSTLECISPELHTAVYFDTLDVYSDELTKLLKRRSLDFHIKAFH